MKTCIFAIVIIFGIQNNYAQAQTDDLQRKIKEAMSAGPSSITANATILDYPTEPGGQNKILRKGTNGWICRPDNPHVPGYNPMCVDSQVFELLSATAEKREPKITRTGFGYFLQGGHGRSNSNPWDNSPTPNNEWMEPQVPHIVFVTPDKTILKGLPTKMDNGGPWVMWSGTPYVHIMIPVPKYIQE